MTAAADLKLDPSGVPGAGGPNKASLLNERLQHNVATKSKLMLPTALWILVVLAGVCFLSLLSSLNKSIATLDTLVELERAARPAQPHPRPDWLAMPDWASLEPAAHHGEPGRLGSLLDPEPMLGRRPAPGEPLSGLVLQATLMAGPADEANSSGLQPPSNRDQPKQSQPDSNIFDRLMADLISAANPAAQLLELAPAGSAQAPEEAASTPRVHIDNINVNFGPSEQQHQQHQSHHQSHHRRRVHRKNKPVPESVTDDAELMQLANLLAIPPTQASRPGLEGDRLNMPFRLIMADRPEPSLHSRPSDDQGAPNMQQFFMGGPIIEELPFATNEHRSPYDMLRPLRPEAADAEQPSGAAELQGLADAQGLFNPLGVMLADMHASEHRRKSKNNNDKLDHHTFQLQLQEPSGGEQLVLLNGQPLLEQNTNDDRKPQPEAASSAELEAKRPQNNKITDLFELFFGSPPSPVPVPTTADPKVVSPSGAELRLDPPVNKPLMPELAKSKHEAEPTPTSGEDSAMPGSMDDLMSMLTLPQFANEQQPQRIDAGAGAGQAGAAPRAAAAAAGSSGPASTSTSRESMMCECSKVGAAPVIGARPATGASSTTGGSGSSQLTGGANSSSGNSTGAASQQSRSPTGAAGGSTGAGSAPRTAGSTSSSGVVGLDPIGFVAVPGASRSSATAELPRAFGVPADRAYLFAPDSKRTETSTNGQDTPTATSNRPEGAPARALHRHPLWPPPPCPSGANNSFPPHWGNNSFPPPPPHQLRNPFPWLARPTGSSSTSTSSSTAGDTSTEASASTSAPT